MNGHTSRIGEEGAQRLEGRPGSDAAATWLAPGALAGQSPHQRYLAFLEQGQLAFQRDRISGRAIFYPRVIAPGSGSDALEWEVAAGTGTVYSTTAIHRRGEAALNVALIDMDEGFRLMSRVEGLPASEVRIGQRVRLRVLRPDDGPPYPVFTAESPTAEPTTTEPPATELPPAELPPAESPSGTAVAGEGAAR